MRISVHSHLHLHEAVPRSLSLGLDHLDLLPPPIAHVYLPAPKLRALVQPGAMA